MSSLTAPEASAVLAEALQKVAALQVISAHASMGILFHQHAT